jgi:hypothetical protein
MHPAVAANRVPAVRFCASSAPLDWGARRRPPAAGTLLIRTALPAAASHDAAAGPCRKGAFGSQCAAPSIAARTLADRIAFPRGCQPCRRHADPPQTHLGIAAPSAGLAGRTLSGRDASPALCQPCRRRALPEPAACDVAPTVPFRRGPLPASTAPQPRDDGLDRRRCRAEPSGSWELGAGSWELGAGSWELGAGSWELGAGSWELGAGGSVAPRRRCPPARR